MPPLDHPGPPRDAASTGCPGFLYRCERAPTNENGDEGEADREAIQHVVSCHNTPPEALTERERRRALREEAQAANSVAQLKKVIVDLLAEP